MITGFRDVYYNVQDMTRPVAFYTGVLGMTLLDESPWWSSLRCGEVRIGLHVTGGDPVPSTPRDSNGSYAGATLTLQSTDARADEAALREAGARVLGVLDEPWGLMVVFEDTEGNVLKLMQPKGT